jgi:paraquat-inducible protein B
VSDVPEPQIKPARKSLLERVSIVWLVPIGALVISLALAWQNYASRGPVIEISFEDAEGIRPGETELRYRDVPVGIVEDVRFSDGLGSVIVDVRLDENVAPYVDEGAEFWVVRPRVTAQGVTGLGTVLSGAYIQGSWDTDPGGTGDAFEGFETVPVARPDVPGLQITLVSPTGDGLLQGTPVLYRGIQVGTVADVELSEDGQVRADAFIEAPHTNLISSSTRFWNASGFSFSLGPQGATLDVSSLAALVSGGVALENLVSGGDPAEPGAVYRLYDGRTAALSSVFVDPDAGDRVRVAFIFGGDVSGLEPSSPVEYRGLQVGEVVDVTGIIDEERFGDRAVRLLATADVDPERLAVRETEGEAGEQPDAEETLAILADLADSGVRAHLERASLFVGGLKIVLAQEETPEEAVLELDAEPYPVFPTTAAEIPEAADTVEGLIARVNELPIEETIDSAIGVLEGVESFVQSDALQQTPEEVLALIGDARSLIGSEAVQEVPAELAAILSSLEEAVGDVQVLLAEFTEAGAAAALTDALASAGPALDAVERLLTAAEPAIAEVPALVERLRAAAEDVATTAATVAALPLSDVVRSAAETAEAAQTLIASDAVQQIPEDASAVLQRLAATLDEVRAAGLVAAASAAVGDASDVAAQFAEAAEGLPALIEEIERVAATIAALPLAETLGSANETLDGAGDLLSSEATQALPAELNAALAELRGIVAEFREAGLVAQVNTTLDDAGEAATAIRDATSGLPAVVGNVEELTRTANTLPLQQLAEDLTGLVEALEVILETEGAQELPAALNGTLAELEATLSELRAGGLVSSANQTLASAQNAALAVEEATAELPALAERLERLAAQAELTLQGYDEGSELTRTAQNTLREVQSAARSISSLARQIERDPNSLILGR